MKKSTSFNCTWSAPLEKPWTNLVGKYTDIVVRHPLPFIIIPIVLTCILSLGLLEFRIVRGVRYLYSPLNAQWKHEEAVLSDNWASDDQHFYPGKDVTRRRGLFLILKCRDGGNILRRNESREVLQILNWVTTVNLTTPSGLGFSYSDVCLRFQNECFNNPHARLVSDIFANQHQVKKNISLNSVVITHGKIMSNYDAQMNISYPIYRTQFATEPIDLTKSLGDAIVNNEGLLQEAKAWSLLYQLKKNQTSVNYLSNQFEKSMADLIEQRAFPSELIDIYYFHSDSFDEHLEKENKRITPKFSITFCVLIIFSIMCTFTIRWIQTPKEIPILAGIFPTFPVIDWVISKPWMGLIGVVSTLMAIISSTGLLLLLDVEFVDMCTVMPFLSLTIGIDDTFLMLAAWHETDRRLPAEKRIQKAVKHAAVSISITSLTDTMAFLIGSIAPLPSVMYFCYYSSAAILFIFLYCLSIFTAFLSLQAKWEESSLNSVTGKPTEDIEHSSDKTLLLTFLFTMGTKMHIEERENDRYINNNNNNNNCVEKELKQDDLKISFHVESRMWYEIFFEDYFGPFVSSPVFSVISLFLFIGYIVVTITGIQTLTIGFDLINIVQKTSNSRRFLEIRSEIFPQDLSLMDIAVMKPPNMANRVERERFMEVLKEFEGTSCSEGRNTTQFWYFAYGQYFEELGFPLPEEQDEKSFTGNLRSFLMSNEKWDYDILWKNNSSTIRAFRLATRLNVSNIDEDIYNCALRIRKLCSIYSEFDIWTYTPLWNIADQFEIMWPQTMQDIYISIAVMIPVSLLFIPQPLCAIAIAMNIGSIAFGVIGFMSHFGVSLDATSMITIAMSVGFSVDFAAHVTFAYMTEEIVEEDPQRAAKIRLWKTLKTVGWPITQAGLSVLLGVSSLFFVDSYVVQTVFKTVVLVITFGTTHALIFLPLLLMYSQKLYSAIFKRKSDTKSVP